LKETINSIKVVWIIRSSNLKKEWQYNG